MNIKNLILVTTVTLATLVSARGQLGITEVSAWGSGNAPYATDWFELTNFGSTAINITGWTMDDSSNSFASSVGLTGITSIAAGESVIFTEDPATASFLSTWFGGNPPAGLQIGNYSGSGVGLSTNGDAVNIFNGSGVLQANVSFGVSPSGPYPTFDNVSGMNGTIATLSVAGVNGAFVAANDSNEIGSPAAIPEPKTYAIMMAGGAMLLGLLRRKRSS